MTMRLVKNKCLETGSKPKNASFRLTVALQYVAFKNRTGCQMRRESALKTSKPKAKDLITVFTFTRVSIFIFVEQTEVGLVEVASPIERKNWLT